MSAPRIILASLPSFCQKLSKLVEIWRRCDKNKLAQLFLRHGVVNVSYIWGKYAYFKVFIYLNEFYALSVNEWPANNYLTQYNDTSAKTQSYTHDRDRRVIWILTAASYCRILGTEQICDCCITWIRLIVWVIPYCMTKATRQLVWCLWLFSPQDQQCQTPVTRSGDSVWCLYLLLRSTNFMQSGLYVYTFLVCSVLCDKLTVSHLVVRFRSDCQYGPQLALLQTKWCALG